MSINFDPAKSYITMEAVTDGEIPNGPDDWTPVSLSTKTTENGSDNSNNGVSLNPDERPSF